MAQAQTAFDWIYYRSLLIHISMNPIFYVRVYVVVAKKVHLTSTSKSKIDDFMFT